MYERQFGLRENPFAAGHQSKYVYPSREHQEALAHLRFGIENREPFVLITGEVGTGKTTALYDALSEWKSRAVVALITNSALTRSELYEEICMRFGVPLSGPVSKPQLINQLERHLLVVRARGDFAILLIDEAQNLDDGLLEETRLLSNLEAQGQKLLQIFLVGQPELEDKLAQPALRQLRQRIAVHYRLRPLSVDETTHYIHHRLSVAGGNAPGIFPPDAAAEVHRVTHGIPREINTVAAQALLNAFVEDSPSVRPEHVRAIVRDTGFHSVLDAPTAPPVAAPASSAPPDALTPAPPPRPAAAAAPSPAVPASSPSAASPVPVSPDAPATTREVRPVPEPAPAPPRGPDETATRSTNAEGQTMAGVRPAGSTESWQSWMDSLAKQTEESVNTPESGGETGGTPAGTEPDDAAPESAPAEMTPEAFDAVEQEAMSAKIGDGEEDEYEEEESDEEESSEVEAEIRHEFDPNEAPGGQPWSSIDAPAVSAATAHAPDFESAPGFQWDAPATARHEDTPHDASWATPERPAPAEPVRTELESSLIDRGAMPAPPVKASEPAPVEHAPVAAKPAPPAPPAPVAATPKPRVAPIPVPTMPVAPALPMRLRERIEAAERAEAEQRGGMAGWLIGAAVVAAIAVGVFFTLRARNHAKPAAATPTSVATPATSAPETAPASETPSPQSATTPAAGEGHSAPMAAPPAAVAPRPTPPVAKPAPTKPAVTTAAAVKPATEAAKPTESLKPAETTKPAVTPAAAKPAVAKARYGVSVGTFLAEDRAKSESERLAAATGLAGRVVAGSDGDFHVVLGAFPDRAAAEKAASNLIGGGKVEEARVVPLK